MITEKVRLIEELAANAWPAEMVQHLGGWRMRYTGGSSRRVNSVWPNQPPSIEKIELAIEMAEAFYQRRGVIPRYKICPAALPADLPQRLEARGYIPDAHTATKTAPLATVLDNTRLPDVEMIGSAVMTEQWFQTYTGASGYSPASLPIRRGIFERIGPQTYYVLLAEDGKPVSAGLGVVERGWMGIFCLVTVPEYRRKGLASGVMHILADWGRSMDAENIYLQVMEDNPPALRLYQQMGFERQYVYSYYQLEPTS